MHLIIRLTEEEKTLPPADLAQRLVHAAARLCKADVHVHKAPEVDGALPALSELVDKADSLYDDRVYRMLEDIAKEASKS